MKEGMAVQVQANDREISYTKYSLTNTGIKELNFSAATGYHDERRA